MVILDFSKAFDTVPHQKLLHKLEHLGIVGKIKKWLSSFLTNRTQQVVTEGILSSTCSVDSGVPQGTVLGPLLFLCHINDLPLSVTSQARLFADDCLLYRKISTPNDQLQLQEDLKNLEKWAHDWGMRFNATKCYKLQMARSKNPHDFDYNLCGHTLDQVKNNPYLGVILNEKLKWQPHVEKISKKANSVLGFLRRNLRHCHASLKETAYVSLVRPILDYACTVWDPHLAGDVQKLESVQRRAARFVCNDYNPCSSVTQMMSKLNWVPLADRRRDQRLVLMYKTLNNHIAITPDTLDIESNLRTNRRHNTRTLKQQHCSTDTFKFSFAPRTIKDWNDLPDVCVTAPTEENFKATLLKHFRPDNYPPPSNIDTQN